MQLRLVYSHQQKRKSRVENNKSEETTNITPPGPQGSRLTPVPTERKMMNYAVTEGELKSITLLNTLAILFFSVGSFCASAVVDLLIDKMYLTAIPPALFSLVSFTVGGLAIRYKSSELDRIRKDAKIL